MHDRSADDGSNSEARTKRLQTHGTYRRVTAFGSVKRHVRATVADLRDVARNGSNGCNGG